MKQIVSLMCLLVVHISTVVAEEKAIDIELPLLSGELFQLSQYKNRVVYLDFWASWCVPCRQSFPWMNAMQQKYKAEDFVIVAINLDENKKMVDNFLKKYPANFAIALDPEGRSADLYQVRVMPSSYLIDRNGNLIKTHMGFRSKDAAKLEEMFKQILEH